MRLLLLWAAAALDVNRNEQPGRPVVMDHGSKAEPAGLRELGAELRARGGMQEKDEGAWVFDTPQGQEEEDIFRSDERKEVLPPHAVSLALLGQGIGRGRAVECDDPTAAGLCLDLSRDGMRAYVSTLQSPHVKVIETKSFLSYRAMDFMGELYNTLNELPEEGATLFVLDHPYHSICSTVHDSMAAAVIAHPRVRNIAAENYDGSNPKIQQHPIGFESNLIVMDHYPDGRAHMLQHVEQNRPVQERKTRVFDDSHLHTFRVAMSGYRDDRGDMIREIASTAVDGWLTGKISYKEDMDRVADSQFVLAPEGNGLDTHRFYHAYALGTGRIVRKGVMSPLHKKFPGTFEVESWGLVNSPSRIDSWATEKWERDLRLLKAGYWVYQAVKNHVERVDTKEAAIAALKKGQFVVIGDVSEDDIIAAFLPSPVDVRASERRVFAVPNDHAVRTLVAAADLAPATLEAAAGKSEARFGPWRLSQVRRESV